METEIDHTNKADLEKLAGMMDMVRPEYYNQFAALILSADLMRPAWHARFLLKLLCWLKKIEVYDAYLEVFNRMPGTSEEFIKATKHHLLNGKDKWNKKSAGGYSQIEIDRLILCINGATGWGTIVKEPINLPSLNITN